MINFDTIGGTKRIVCQRTFTPTTEGNIWQRDISPWNIELIVSVENLKKDNNSLSLF